MPSCSHLGSVKITQLPASVDGCEDCLKAGTLWLHLRICLECGHVGCCDDSPEQHATKHQSASGHPIIRSLQPDEDWCYCYPDDLMMIIPEIQGHTHIPPSPLMA